jgi:hypothetical protein
MAGRPRAPSSPGRWGVLLKKVPYFTSVTYTLDFFFFFVLVRGGPEQSLLERYYYLLGSFLAPCEAVEVYVMLANRCVCVLVRVTRCNFAKRHVLYTN